MQLELISDDSKVKIGIKQTTKVLEQDNAKILLIAKDAEQYVVRQVLELADKNNVEIVYVDSMKKLGMLCNIDVGAATAVIEK